MPARKQNCVWLYLKINKSTCINQKLARMPCEMLITWKRYAGHSCSNETTPQMHGSHYIGLHCMGCTAWAALHGAALHGAALHGVALRGAALRGAALHGVALHGAALHGAALHETALHIGLHCIG